MQVARGSMATRRAFSRFANPKGLSRFAWAVLFYNLAVILWGAYVRSSSSGAGCGSHWPLCQGQIVPMSSEFKTWVEFIHRASSGVSLILSGFIAYWGVSSFPRRHPARGAAIRVLIFTLMEAAIGAFIVLLGLVAEDRSMTRAVSISLHYANTLLLLASLAQTAWRSVVERGSRLHAVAFSSVSTWRVALAGVVLTGATGAITALGDTLFPATSLVNGIQAEFAPDAPRLLALRIYHPILAVSVAVYLFWFLDARLGVRFDDRVGRRIKAWLNGTLVLQLALGLSNVVLLAPTALQLIHLLVAQTIWVLLISLRERA